jgi:hypothetical protein
LNCDNRTGFFKLSNGNKLKGFHNPNPKKFA